MLDARRPMGRLFYWALLLVVCRAWAQGPTLTTINDVVFRADGTAAGGTLLISWQEFSTAASQAVAAGNQAVTLGSGGALTVQLAPNAGATPSNTLYTVVYQLDDGTEKTEFWMVGTSSPETIAEVRTTPGSTVATSQFATEQYVNSALAAKANDNAVVHLSGAETVSGIKQFTVSPSFPTPVNPPDAVNKSYVDSAVENSGSGNFVSKAGDTMTGPLTLPGAPTAPNQAATKQYVDSSSTNKADLISGIVPTGELAAGVANNGVCLHGDSTWGACGTSSNAVSIQGTLVATTAPTNNEVLAYSSSTGQYAPAPGGGVSAGMQAVKYATDFAWSQTATGNLATPGAVTVTLTACPAGVTGNEPQYYVYVSGTGTPEAVLVTGGTCAGNGSPGTLQFTTTNSHASGYSISSASSGLQEALIAARYIPQNPAGASQAGKVIVPPGEFNAYARVSIRSSGMTVDFAGSIVNCYLADTCIFVGDPSTSTLYSDITLISPRGRPMVASGQNPFIQDNAQKTRLFNVSTRVGATNGTFSTYVQVDDDEAFLLDGLDTTLGAVIGNSGVLCNATTCNPVVYAPGPFSTFPAVGWLKNLNISMQCTGNGVDWQSGNTLRISDSVIQGFSQYGVRAGTKRGGFGGFDLENVYEEVGNCPNPAGAVGHAGVIAQGGTVKIEGGEAPNGNVPQFANTGSTNNHYYIVAQNSSYGPSNPLYAGSALTSGTGNITVTTPDIAGATSFDLLRTTFNGTNPEQAPFGTGNFAVITGVSRSLACASGVCTFTDPQTALQSYSVALPTYFPLLDFWPGNLILGTNQDSSSVLTAARAFTQNMPSDLVAVQGIAEPAAISTNCDSLGSWTPAWVSCFSAMAPSSFYQQGALLLAVKPNQDAGQALNLKGRLNFPTLGSAPGHIITLSDSNFQKTIATANNRPTNDANDAFIGYDQGDGNPAHIGITMGAPVSLSNYIGNVGDGTNWLERLTAGLKEFKANVQMDGNLSVAGTLQASSIALTGPGAWSVQANFAPLSPAPIGKSLIGFGTNGLVQVSENGGAVSTVAILNSNGDVSSNAISATQLELAPTQCSGSFATGIQANGNANCGTASIIQMAETSQPAGIPNYGLFWFDSTCHCPKVLDNNGQPVQLGLTNVFNSDANTLQEVNGLNPQDFQIYSSYTSSSNYGRLELGYDGTTYFIGDTTDGTNGSHHGIGIKLSGNTSWFWNTAGDLKPGSVPGTGGNTYSIGGIGNELKNLYFRSSLNGGPSGWQSFMVANESTTGTTLNKPVKLSGSPSTAIIASANDLGIVGIAISGAGITGNVEIAVQGFVSCQFDNAATAGDYVGNASSGSGCHDLGSGYPSSAQVLGRVMAGGDTSAVRSILLESQIVPSTGASFPTMTPGGMLLAATSSTVTTTSARLDASQFSGSDAFAQINACISALPSSGGICDARNLAATNSVSTTLAISKNGVELDFGSSTFTAASGTLIAISGSNVEFNCLRGAGGTDFNFTAGTGSGTPGTPAGSPDINITGTSVRMRGCSIQGNRIASGDTYSGSDCVRATSATGLLLEDNTVTQCGAYGIGIGNTDSFTVRRNYIAQTSGPGINVNSSTGGPYYGLKLIQDNQVYDVVTSVGLAGTYPAIPTGNYQLNVASSGGWGKTRNVRVLDNTIANDAACTAGTGCDLSQSKDVCLGAGTAQATGCLGGMQVLANVDFEVAGNVVRNTQAEGIAVSGTSGNIHDNEESLIHVNTSGSVVNDGSGCVSFFISNINVGSPTTQGDSKIHDNHCYDAGYVVQLILGSNTNADGLTVENLDVHNNHGSTLSNVLDTGIKIVNTTDSNTPCAGGTRACQWTIVNSSFSDNDVKASTTPFSLDPTGLTDSAGWAAYGPSGWIGSTPVAQLPLQSVAGFISGTGSTVNIPSTATLTTGDYVKASGSAAITDAGVAAGPYSIPWLTAPTLQTGSPVSFNSSASKAQLWGLVLSWPLSTTKVNFDVVAADSSSCTYDLGLINTSGNIVVHTGNQTASTLGMNATGWHSFNWSNSGTIQPGKYYVAITASATSGCATLGGSSSGSFFTFAGNQPETVSTAGTLNNGMTVPADSYTASTIPALSIN